MAYKCFSTAALIHEICFPINYKKKNLYFKCINKAPSSRQKIRDLTLESGNEHEVALLVGTSVIIVHML